MRNEKIILETPRLILREMTENDHNALYAVIGDAQNMKYYQAPYDDAGTDRWIRWCVDSYAENGFGLWAVCLKETGEMIGDCGISMQNIDGATLPEVGFHIRGDCQRKGYAKEAASAVRDWAFRNTDFPALYSYCNYRNTASYKTAESIGMRFLKEFPDEKNGKDRVSILTRDEWQKK